MTQAIKDGSLLSFFILPSMVAHTLRFLLFVPQSIVYLNSGWAWLIYTVLRNLMQSKQRINAINKGFGFFPLLCQAQNYCNCLKRGVE
tara:strand:+ start:136 stop:399 length:264 start_codon:yes stop_codon:yes gene_type:complete